MMNCTLQLCVLKVILFLYYLDAAVAVASPCRRTCLRTVGSSLMGGSVPMIVKNSVNAESPPSDLLIPTLSGAKFAPEYDGQWFSSGLQTKLGRSRILAQELNPLQQVSFFDDNELYYAPFLFGSWKVKATLKSKVYPYGKFYVPSKSLIQGSPRNRDEQVGQSTTYDLHYFSAEDNAKDSNSNANKSSTTVTLGPKAKVIADRSFNAISISREYQQLAPIQEVVWDPRKDPTRLSLNFGSQPVTDDMRPLGPRRAEVYIDSRQSEFHPDGSSYACAEKSRTVTISTGSVIVSDTESTTEFQKIGPDQVHAVNRIAVYLTPNPNSREGVLWQEVRGKAVAFFDYELEMQRSDGEACVKTPKGVLQCV
mmetsp:Transcript_8484/g.13273  ORF Transcript_8484/g.13273 Transcript_8484/m.13273 type:complete len:367 (+) Transcript_8484:87-1187(+)